MLIDRRKRIANVLWTNARASIEDHQPGVREVVEEVECEVSKHKDKVLRKSG